MAGSAQSWPMAELEKAACPLAQSGTVKKPSVSAGNNFSAGGTSWLRVISCADKSWADSLSETRVEMGELMAAGATFVSAFALISSSRRKSLSMDCSAEKPLAHAKDKTNQSHFIGECLSERMPWISC